MLPTCFCCMPASNDDTHKIDSGYNNASLPSPIRIGGKQVETMEAARAYIKELYDHFHFLNTHCGNPTYPTDRPHPATYADISQAISAESQSILEDYRYKDMLVFHFYTSPLINRRFSITPPFYFIPPKVGDAPIAMTDYIPGDHPWQKLGPRSLIRHLRKKNNWYKFLKFTIQVYEFHGLDTTLPSAALTKFKEIVAPNMSPLPRAPLEIMVDMQRCIVNFTMQAADILKYITDNLEKQNLSIAMLGRIPDHQIQSKY